MSILTKMLTNNHDNIQHKLRNDIKIQHRHDFGFADTHNLNQCVKQRTCIETILGKTIMANVT